MPRKHRFESPDLQVAYDRFVGNKRRGRLLYDEALVSAEIARRIYDLRVAARLTQRELAMRVDTTASVISRLEDADYTGHSLAMLRRIAEALGQRLELRFVPIHRSKKAVRGRRASRAKVAA